MRKVVSIALLAAILFNLSSLFSFAASFDPIYSGIFSDSNPGVSPSVTLAIYVNDGDDMFSQIVFNFPAGFDIKGSSDISDGSVIGTGSFGAKIGGSQSSFPVTVRSYSQGGAKALWQYTIAGINIDGVLTGSAAAGHTLTINSPSGFPTTSPIQFVINYVSGVFVNPGTGGPFVFSAHMTSVNNLTADPFWNGSILNPPPGETPPPPPSPPPPPIVTPPSRVPVVPSESPKVEQPVAKSNVAPIVTLDKLTSPSNKERNLVTGKVVFVNTVKKVEVSLDNGKNWFSAAFKPAFGKELSFEFLSPNLEDDNYIILARAIDDNNKVGISEKQTLVVDTAPPIVGSNELILAGSSIFPDENGTIEAVVGVGQKIILSAKGGASKVAIKTANSQAFNLIRIEDTNLWQGEVKFEKSGLYPLKVEAEDGAGNITSRNYNSINVLPRGKVVDQDRQTVVEAKVKLFFQDKGEWLEWDGESYGQKNPYQTTNGTYSFFVPEGKYYLEVEASGYRKFVSTEFAISKPSEVNFKIPLTKLPKINLFGIGFNLPSWLDFGATTETVSLQKETIANSGTKVLPNLPDFTTTDLLGGVKKLSDFKGTPVIFSFWSTWNQAAAAQLEEISKVKGVRVVTIASQNSQGEVISYLNRAGLTVEVLIDKQGQLGEYFGITTVPEHFFLDKDGKVLDLRIGIYSAKDLLEISTLMH